MMTSIFSKRKGDPTQKEPSHFEVGILKFLKTEMNTSNLRVEEAKNEKNFLRLPM